MNLKIMRAATTITRCAHIRGPASTTAYIIPQAVIDELREGLKDAGIVWDMDDFRMLNKIVRQVVKTQE